MHQAKELRMKKNYKAPRNKAKFVDLFEIIRYTFSLNMFKEIMFSFGYFIHDKVASKAKMNIAGNPRIHPTSLIRCGENVYLGRNSHINAYCCIWASPNSKIILGDNLLMGPGCKIFSSNHSTNETDIPMSIESVFKPGVDLMHYNYQSEEDLKKIYDKVGITIY